MRRTILFFLLFVALIPARAQFSEVSKFPYTLHNNESNAKILDLGDNHLILIMANDSLFISHSYDNGSTWGDPVPIWSGSLIQHLDAIVLPTGRLVVEFSTTDIQTIYSDDKGNTWSSPVEIYTTSREIKLYYSDKLYAFMAASKHLYYWTSEDGDSWSFYTRIANIVPFNIVSFSFVEFSTGNYTVALAGTLSEVPSIVIKNSDTLDGSWTDLSTAFQSTNSISDIDGLKDDSGKLWLSFSVTKTLYQETFKNVCYITSEDGGNNWSEPVPFGKSFQDDWNVRVSPSGNNPLSVFLTNRNGATSNMYYGKLGISEDIHYTPFLKDYSTHLIEDYPNTVTVVATARAFTDQVPLTVSLTLNGAPTVTMYDDGRHNDGIAGDSIYGASYTFNYSDIGEESFLVGFFATDINQSSLSLNVLTLNPPLPNNWDTYVLRNGNTRLPVKSNGVIADVSSYTQFTTYDGIPVIFSAGFMMSGKTNGEIWSNAMASSSRIQDYVSGTIGDTSTAVYVVKSSDPPFGDSWQNWSNAVAKGAYFYDGDGDGVYNPVDLNSNGQWDENEDCPDILGDVTVWTVYNDGVPSENRTFSDVSPQGIEIRQTVWTKYGEDYNKNVYYIRYSIVNRGTIADTLKDVYFGLWADNDDGLYLDDLVGCSIPLQSGYTYNNGYDENFRGSAPGIMTTLLQGPIRYTGNSNDEATNNMGNLLGIQRISGAVNDTVTAFIHYMNSHPTQGQPQNKEQVRNYLLGLTPQGDVIDPCSWQYGEVLGEDCSTIDGHFMYSGNPYDSIGWINTQEDDQRQMLSTGPFELIKDQPVDIIAAYHFSKGETSAESVNLGLAKAQELLNNFRPDGVDERNGNNLADKFELKQNYPNPFNPTTTISYSIPSVIARSGATRQSTGLSVQLKVYDILGREVATLVSKKQTPGKYSVQFDARYLPSGVYFYTLQAGDFVQTRKMVLIK